MLFKDKIALVTGGSQGIGKAIALMLAQHGAKLIVNYNKYEAGAIEVVRKSRDMGIEAVSCQADVGNLQDINNLMEVGLSNFGKIDILVNNAAIAPYSPFLDLDPEIWQRTLDVNLSSVFYLSQLVARQMISKSIKGKIINISSLGGEKAMRGLSSYNASKGGLNLLTKTMALELGPYGICVNGVAPGVIEVERNKSQREKSNHINSWKKIIPLKRWGRPEEVAKAVMFLASEDNTYISGQIITVDGGQMAQVPQPLYDYMKWES